MHIKERKSHQITVRMTEQLFQKLLREAGSGKDLPDIIRRKLDEESLHLRTLESLKTSLEAVLSILKDHCLDSAAVEIRMKKIVEGYTDEKKIEEANAIRKAMEDKINKFSKVESV